MDLTKQEFEEISSKSPIVNVDLLIQNEKKEILLSWRDDEFDIGWHFPGRCVRHQETLIIAAKKCFIDEIGVYDKNVDPFMIDYNEIINYERKVRAHFISFLYKYYLNSKTSFINNSKKETDGGYLKWFYKMPNNLIDCHKEVYSQYFMEK
jgi:colanic acid biosynthesis protein WcaH